MSGVKCKQFLEEECHPENDQRIAGCCDSTLKATFRVLVLVNATLVFGRSSALSGRLRGSI